jgi:hypothetical protein
MSTAAVNVDTTPSAAGAGAEGSKDKWAGKVGGGSPTMKARPRSNSTAEEQTIEEQMVDLFRPPSISNTIEDRSILADKLNAMEETFLNDQRVVEPNVVEADLAAKFDKTTMNEFPQVSIFSRCWLRACAVLWCNRRRA